ncbi:MAG: enoyl-CoA hydratase-related protein, partial [Sphingomicrobium sp.]
MAGQNLIEAQASGRVLRLTLNNPPANLLSLAAMESLQAELDAAREEDTARVIILAAAGKLFSAGHDLKEMTQHRSDPDGGRS